MIRLKKGWYAIEDYSGEGIEPNYWFGMGFDKRRLLSVIHHKPMPQDEAYGLEDFLEDLESEGLWTFPEGMKEETARWIEEVLNESWG